jgi:hypothetical protein
MFSGFEVNVLPELRHQHDAGYNILTYDLRNHSMCGDGNGGIAGLGLLECRDVVGSVRYTKGRKELAAMRTGLYSRCMGGNSTIIAMDKGPEEFEHIKAMVLRWCRAEPSSKRRQKIFISIRRRRPSSSARLTGWFDRHRHMGAASAPGRTGDLANVHFA